MEKAELDSEVLIGRQTGRQLDRDNRGRQGDSYRETLMD